MTSTTANPLHLSLGTISRAAGGTLDFTLPSGTQSTSNGINTTSTNTNGILGTAPFATVNGTNWASSTGTAGYITALTTSTTGNLGTLASGAHPQRLAYRHADRRHFRQVVLHAQSDRQRGGHDERYGFADPVAA